MKRAATIFILSAAMTHSAITAFGTSVLWNQGLALKGNGENWSIYWNWPYTDDVIDGRLYPTVGLTSAFNAQSGTTEVQSDGSVNVGFGYNWVVLQSGDIVDASTTLDQDAYFLHGWMDWKEGDPVDDIGRTDYSVKIPADGTSPFYLAFATEYLAPGPNLTTVFGWVEMFADENRLILGNTAIDLSGGPLVVGQIPEPGTGCLAAMGAVVLLFKKRKRPDRPANIIHALSHGMQGDGTGNATSPLVDVHLI